MIPKDTLSELLFYLADHEEFKSVESLGSFTPQEVRDVLRELALSLRQQADQEETGKIDVKHLEELSSKVKHALSTLTPRELKSLVKHFDIES